MSDSDKTDDKALIESVESLLKNELDGNKPFNMAFNEAFNRATKTKGPIPIPSLIKDQDPYEFEPCELLFFTDRSAYYDEQEHWSDASIFEEHEAALTVITDFDQLPVFKELIGAIERRRVAPFIGAGMSYACGYPMWGEALEKVKAKVGAVDEDAFQAAIDAYDYLEAAQILWDAGDVHLRNFIRTEFSDGRLPKGKVIGPALHLPRISFGCIVTTNFDPVIETVFDKKLDAYMHGVQEGHNFVSRLVKGQRCLLKLHGDAENHGSYIFTKQQYEDAYGNPFDFSKTLPKALRQIFVSQSLLFLGCSLENDKTLELFSHVCKSGDFEIPSHFAILPAPTDAANKTAKEKRLLDMNINPIWFPDGEFHLLEDLIHLLVDASTKRIGV